MGEQEILEEVARLVVPEAATVHHLCAVGAGTFSVTTRRHDQDGDSGYALKVVSEVRPGAGRSELELEAVCSIDHPNLVRYRDTGTLRHENRAYRWLAMDLVEGQTVAQLLADGVVFDLSAAVRILLQAVSGAGALWDMGMDHRDLVADNLVMTPSGDVVVVDLGLGHQSTDPQPGDPDEGWRSDQGALGLIGYRLANGADDVDPAVRARLAQAIAKMLAPRPRDRFASPADLRAELGAIADACEAAVAADPARVERTGSTRHHHVDGSARR